MRGVRSVAMPLVIPRMWGREEFAVTVNVVLSVAVALVSVSCASRSSSVPSVPPIPEPPSVPSPETSKPPTAPETEPPSTPSSETGSSEASSKEAPSASEATGASESAASSAENAASQSTESGARSQVEVGEASRASTSSGGAPSASGRESSEGGQGGVETAGEKQAGLEGKLDKSLSEFDELLLKEQELLEERRETSAVDPQAVEALRAVAVLRVARSAEVVSRRRANSRARSELRLRPVVPPVGRRIDLRRSQWSRLQVPRWVTRPMTAATTGFRRTWVTAAMTILWHVSFVKRQ